MVKRFCDTDIWQKEWFLNLSAVERQLFLYIKDNCDCAGFYVPNYAMLSFVMGQKITKEDFKNLKQVVFVDEDVIFIEDFIKFQYNVFIEELNPKYSVHRGIIKRLNKYGIFGTLTKQLRNTYSSIQDKDKVKDKDKDFSILQESKEKEEKEEKEKIKKEKEEKEIEIQEQKVFEPAQNVETVDSKEIEPVEENKPIYNTRLLGAMNRINAYAVNPDLMYDSDIQTVFKLYKGFCHDLLPLRFEPRDAAVRLKVKEFLGVVSGDFSYIQEVFKKANELKTIVDKKIDFLSAINNHARIHSGFYVGQNQENDYDSTLAYAKKLQEEYEKERLNE